MTPALWISFIPALVSITGFAFLGFAMQMSLAALAFLGLLLFGLVPLLALTEMAEAELARGTSVGHYALRTLVIVVTFVVFLSGASVLAVSLLSIPIGWVLLYLVGSMPATLTTVILNFRSHRLPRDPYTGPLIEIKWR